VFPISVRVRAMGVPICEKSINTGIYVDIKIVFKSKCLLQNEAGAYGDSIYLIVIMRF
jgi:hypothetical protein